MTLLTKLRPALLTAIFFVLAFDLAFAWQKMGGAYESEFGGHPDEAAHYVTGLMVRDYIASGLPGSPMAYAESYYSHYPKIGLGVWPPFFYAVQSAWTLPFGAGRLAVLLLMAAIAGTCGAIIFGSLRKEVGGWIAAIAALCWLSLPLIREQYGMIMAEGLSAVLMLAATLALGAFLDHGRTRDAVYFGVFSGLAILTKGTGLALAFMALLAVLLSRKWSIVLRPALWGGGAIAVLLAGPWTWKFKDLGKGGWLYPGPTWEFTREALPYYLGKYAVALGPVLLVLAAAGAVVLILRRGASSGKWAAIAALVPAVIVFQSLAPVGLEARHLIPAIAPALMFAAVALGGFAALIQRRMGEAERRKRWVPPVVGAAAALVILLGSLPVHKKGFTGFAPLADFYVNTATAGDAVLVSSDARGEGMFIAEVAMRDPQRPSFTVRRASKELAASEWSGRGYQPKYTNNHDLLAYLKSGKVRYVVRDDSVPAEKRVEHHEDLRTIMLSEGDAFWPLGEGRVQRGGEIQTGSVRLFRIGKAAASEN
jgi:hypothetical protein